MKEYQPAEGSQTEKVLAHLREHGPQHAWQIAEALGIRAANIGPLLVAAIKHQAVVKRGRQRAALYMLADQVQQAELGISLKLEGEGKPPEPACAGSAEPQDFKLAAWNDGDLVLTGPGLRIMADDQGNADSVILSAAQAAALVAFVTQPRVAL